MGTYLAQKKIFRCQECGYETEIYDGRGFIGQHIEAMSCPDCRNIVPLVVGGVICRKYLRWIINLLSQNVDYVENKRVKCERKILFILR